MSKFDETTRDVCIAPPADDRTVWKDGKPM